MKRFWFRLLCVLAIVALVVAAPLMVEPGPVQDRLDAYVFAALQAAAIIGLVWAVARRTRGSLIKSILLWILAVPTVFVSLFLALLVVAVANNPRGNDDVVLVVIPILGILGGGIAGMLVLAALPKKRVSAQP
jgi:hypothetical protein